MLLPFDHRQYVEADKRQLHSKLARHYFFHKNQHLKYQAFPKAGWQHNQWIRSRNQYRNCLFLFRLNISPNDRKSVQNISNANEGHQLLEITAFWSLSKLWEHHNLGSRPRQFHTSWQAWRPEVRLCQRVNISVFFSSTKKVLWFVSISLAAEIMNISKKDLNLVLLFF